jgi:hypothetical protein
LHGAIVLAMGGGSAFVTPSALRFRPRRRSTARRTI